MSNDHIPGRYFCLWLPAAVLLSVGCFSADGTAVTSPDAGAVDSPVTSAGSGVPGPGGNGGVAPGGDAGQGASGPMAGVNAAGAAGTTAGNQVRVLALELAPYRVVVVRERSRPATVGSGPATVGSQPATVGSRPATVGAGSRATRQATAQGGFALPTISANRPQNPQA